MNVFHLAGALCMFSVVRTEVPDASTCPPGSPECWKHPPMPPMPPLPQMDPNEAMHQDRLPEDMALVGFSVIITLVVLGTGAVLAVIFAITVCVVKNRQGKRILKQDGKALEAGSKSKDESMSMPAEPAVEATHAEAAVAPDAQAASPQSKSHSSSKE